MNGSADTGGAEAGSGMASPEISVIVPVYNVAADVAAALGSLMSQSFTAFEALVVDDGSVDRSGDIARATIGNDPRFRVIRQPNGGLSAARNTGLDIARAPIIGFLDSDDRFHPEFLAHLHARLIGTGAAWAACAVELTGGARHPASAIHGRPHPVTERPWRDMPLNDWRKIIRHWPSAWNKLYRRDLIGETRFTEGTYFEDHEWYQALADRADYIAYTPRPLYRHQRGRRGQITGEDSDRVFEQFDVLDRCARIIGASAKPGGAEAIARLSTRLIDERAGAISGATRRARYAKAARSYMADRGLRWQHDWDRGISRAFAEMAEGHLPLSVVIATDGVGPGLRRSLRALARQGMRDHEVIVVPSRPGADTHDHLTALSRPETLPGRPAPDPAPLRVLGPGTGCVAEARNRGLAAAQGRYVVFLDAGDQPGAATLWIWVEAMLREDADMGVSRFRSGGGKVHPGTQDGADPQGRPWPAEVEARAGASPLDLAVGRAGPLDALRALQLHPHPSAKIFRTRFLRETGLAFPPEPLGSWAMTISAACRAARVVPLATSGMDISEAATDRRLRRARAAPGRLHTALMRLAPVLDPAPGRDCWYPVLMARALWENANVTPFRSRAEQQAWFAEARDLLRGTHPVLPKEIDPCVGPRIRTLFAP